MASKQTPASAVALGGVMAALAMVIMGLGTLIPVATYVCPVLCVLMLQLVLKSCGTRMAWAWYGAVAFLSMFLCQDTEAAVLFAFLGYYPILKPRLDARKGKWLWKGLLFNGMVLLAYWVLLRLLGVERLASEFSEMGFVMGFVLLILGNVTFVLMDRLLGMGFRKRRK